MMVSRAIIPFKGTVKSLFNGKETPILVMKSACNDKVTSYNEKVTTCN